MAVAGMGRVERAAEETDAPSGSRAAEAGKPGRAPLVSRQGRTWPVPRTTYL